MDFDNLDDTMSVDEKIKFVKGYLEQTNSKKGAAFVFLCIKEVCKELFDWIIWMDTWFDNYQSEMISNFPDAVYDKSTQPPKVGPVRIHRLLTSQNVVDAAHDDIESDDDIEPENALRYVMDGSIAAVNTAVDAIICNDRVVKLPPLKEGVMDFGPVGYYSRIAPKGLSLSCGVEFVIKAFPEIDIKKIVKDVEKIK